MWGGIRRSLKGMSVVAAASAVAMVAGYQIKEETNVGKSASKAFKNNGSHSVLTAIEKSRDVLKQFKEETGAPGIIVGVSIDGKNIWEEGIGYADVENRLSCNPDTVMRIASISKAITMTAVAKVWQEGQLDLDKPVQDYVPDFPNKYHDGERVTITTRQLVCHISGIRHYKDNSEDNKIADTKDKKPNYRSKEFLSSEYLIKDHYQSVGDSLKLFKDDPIVFKPGSKYLYTTHGWTLISAVLESVVKKPFDIYISQLFKDFGMHHTYLDVHEKLIPHRARFYVKNDKGYIENAPYVDNSYKWAGGGMLSTVGDLLRFGNIMLYSFQHGLSDADFGKTKLSHSDSGLLPIKDVNEPEQKGVFSSPPTTTTLPGFLKRSTVNSVWTPISKSKPPGSFYGMGWMVFPSRKEHGFCEDRRFVAGHSGAAVGASSVLLIMPEKLASDSYPPKGIVVTVLTNLQEVSLWDLVFKIAKNFDDVSTCQ